MKTKTLGIIVVSMMIIISILISVLFLINNINVNKTIEEDRLIQIANFEANEAFDEKSDDLFVNLLGSFINEFAGRTLEENVKQHNGIIITGTSDEDGSITYDFVGGDGEKLNDFSNLVNSKIDFSKYKMQSLKHRTDENTFELKHIVYGDRDTFSFVDGGINWVKEDVTIKANKIEIEDLYTWYQYPEMLNFIQNNMLFYLIDSIGRNEDINTVNHIVDEIRASLENVDRVKDDLHIDFFIHDDGMIELMNDIDQEIYELLFVQTDILENKNIKSYQHTHLENILKVHISNHEELKIQTIWSSSI